MRSVDEEDELRSPLLSLGSRNIQDSTDSQHTSDEDDSGDSRISAGKKSKEARRRITSISRRQRHYMKDNL